MKSRSEISQQDLNQEKWPASGLTKMAGGSSCSATSILLPEMVHHKLAHEGPVTTDQPLFDSLTCNFSQLLFACNFADAGLVNKRDTGVGLSSFVDPIWCFLNSNQCFPMASVAMFLPLVANSILRSWQAGFYMTLLISIVTMTSKITMMEIMPTTTSKRIIKIQMSHTELACFKP